MRCDTYVPWKLWGQIIISVFTVLSPSLISMCSTLPFHTMHTSNCQSRRKVNLTYEIGYSISFIAILLSLIIYSHFRWVHFFSPHLISIAKSIYFVFPRGHVWCRSVGEINFNCISERIFPSAGIECWQLRRLGRCVCARSRSRGLVQSPSVYSTLIWVSISDSQ